MVRRKRGLASGYAIPRQNGKRQQRHHRSLHQFEGLPGVFNQIELLKYGDVIYIEAFGERYTYMVDDVETVFADTPQVLSQKTDQSLLTLLTCKYWDEETGEYNGRIVVQSVLQSVSAAG